jgi:hypothetical protein
MGSKMATYWSTIATMQNFVNVMLAPYFDDVQNVKAMQTGGMIRGLKLYIHHNGALTWWDDKRAEAPILTRPATGVQTDSISVIW